MSAQHDLFGVAPACPAGLTLVTEAVSHEEAARLEGLVDAAPLAPFRFQRWTGRRLTASYGAAYDHAAGRRVEDAPFPAWLHRLAQEIAPLVGVAADQCVQALLIRYDPGAGIGWHRDRPHYGEVLGLSLSAPATMRFRRRSAGGFDRVNVPLPPRSLYRLSGEAREQWEHSIAPMEVTRRSITLRTLR